MHIFSARQSPPVVGPVLLVRYAFGCGPLVRRTRRHQRHGYKGRLHLLELNEQKGGMEKLTGIGVPTIVAFVCERRV